MNFYTNSAWGIVVRKAEDYVQIVMLRDKRYADWTLPKGHVEDWESLEEACVREVYEEVWLSWVIIHQLLDKVERQVRDTDEIKTIYYYLMTLENPDIWFSLTIDNVWFELKRINIDELPKFYLKEQEELVKKNFGIIKNVCS